MNQSKIHVSSDANRAIAKAAEAAFGGRMSEASRHYGPDRVCHVDIIRCLDRPQPGVTSFATVGLSDAPLYRNGEVFSVRAEFVAACAADDEWMSSVIASAAFMVIRSHEFCAPGVIFRDVVSAYRSNIAMQHVLFTVPFLWGDDEPKAPSFAEKTVGWLQLVPVSEAEARYADQHGFAALEEVLERSEIDIFDLSRPSVL